MQGGGGGGKYYLEFVIYQGLNENCFAYLIDNVI